MITSAGNAKIKQVIQWQIKARERKRDQVYVAEGFKMYEEAPETDIVEVYLTEEALEKMQKNPLLCDKAARSGYEQVSPELFRKMSDTQTPQGILTVVRQPKYRLEELLCSENPLLVVLENLQDPGNLGTILRTGEGAGITGVIMSDHTVDIFNPKTVRAAMGSLYRVPFVYEEDMKDILQKLHQHGIHTYAAHLAGETYYDSFSFRQPTAFLIGNEGGGLRRETADLAEHYLKIPMEGRVESLNAAIATSLLMYEAHRQRSRSAGKM